MSDLCSPEAHVRLLLCSRLALPKNAPEQPLKAAEWTVIEHAMSNAGLDAAELLGSSAAGIAQSLAITGTEAERVASLLSRSGPLAVELDRLSARGIWTLTRGDAGYPQRWMTLLSDRAPVVIYGAGDQQLLAGQGVAVVGSRNADDRALAFARRIGECCAAAKLHVISGLARGVDRESMVAAVSASGHAIGIIADDLTRTIRDPEVREAIENGQLSIASASEHYTSAFTIARAMERNVFIYTLAEAAVIVSAGEKTGGTWDGAQKNLKRRWVPMFIRDGEGVPLGNSALVKAGAHPLHLGQLTPEFVRAMRYAELPSAANAKQQATLSLE